MSLLKGSIVALLLGLANTAAAAEEQVAVCSKPVASDNAAYAAAATEAIGLMAKRSYAQAAERFERALAVPLGNQPNSELLPCLALAHFRAGDKEKALTALENAEAAVRVRTGLDACVEAGGWTLQSEHGRVELPQREELEKRLCGSAYRDFYDRSELESFARDAELVRDFLAIQKEIRSGPFGSNAPCSVRELTYDPRYNQLACEGAALMEKRAYAEAAERFERALALSLFEEPNYLLLPRLALARFRAGEKEKALAALEEAELTLRVRTGLIECVETDGWNLYVDGRPVRSAQASAAAKRMCGPLYEDYYTRSELAAFVSDAELVRAFLAVRTEVRSGQPPKAR